MRTTTGVVLEYSSFIRSGVRNEPGTLITAGDKQLLLSAIGIDGLLLSAPPKADDTATLANGTVYTITTDAPLSPSGIDVIYDCNIRGSK